MRHRLFNTTGLCTPEDHYMVDPFREYYDDVLMAFLQRILNGGGRIEREMAIGNGRTDLAVFWKDQVIPIGLKCGTKSGRSPMA